MNWKTSGIAIIGIVSLMITISYSDKIMEGKNTITPEYNTEVTTDKFNKGHDFSQGIRMQEEALYEGIKEYYSKREIDPPTFIDRPKIIYYSGDVYGIEVKNQKYYYLVKRYYPEDSTIIDWEIVASSHDELPEVWTDKILSEKLSTYEKNTLTDNEYINYFENSKEKFYNATENMLRLYYIRKLCIERQTNGIKKPYVNQLWKEQVIENSKKLNELAEDIMGIEVGSSRYESSHYTLLKSIFAAQEGVKPLLRDIEEAGNYPYFTDIKRASNLFNKATAKFQSSKNNIEFDEEAYLQQSRQIESNLSNIIDKYYKENLPQHYRNFLLKDWLKKSDTQYSVIVDESYRIPEGAESWTEEQFEIYKNKLFIFTIEQNLNGEWSVLSKVELKHKEFKEQDEQAKDKVKTDYKYTKKTSSNKYVLLYGGLTKQKQGVVEVLKGHTNGYIPLQITSYKKVNENCYEVIVLAYHDFGTALDRKHQTYFIVKFYDDDGKENWMVTDDPNIPLSYDRITSPERKE